MKQQPLSVYALFHSKNPEGQKIYTELYSLLCRDINNPFMDGLDIPVFYASGVDNINPCVESKAKRKCTLFLLISTCIVQIHGVSILMKS